MITQNKYTKVFVSNDMTRLKYDELYEFAEYLCDHKNVVSRYVNENLLHFLEYSKFDFIKEIGKRYKGVVPSSFDTELYTQVYVCYQNKFDAIRRQTTFESRIFKGFEESRV